MSETTQQITSKLLFDSKIKIFKTEVKGIRKFFIKNDIMRICFAVDDGPEAEAAFDCKFVLNQNYVRD